MSHYLVSVCVLRRGQLKPMRFTVDAHSAVEAQHQAERDAMSCIDGATEAIADCVLLVRRPYAA